MLLSENFFNPLDLTKILLKVMLNTITPNLENLLSRYYFISLCFVFKFLKLLNVLNTSYVADVILGFVYGIENTENNMWASWVEQKCKLILYIFQVN